MDEEEVSMLIHQWTLKNALEHDGNANTNAVIGKLIAEKPELKSEINDLKDKIEKTVGEINSLSKKEQEKELEKVGAPKRPEKEKSEGLAELPEREKYEKITTRFAPNPNGPLHLGHVKTAVLSHEYARRNDGKFILRFEDTNPENARKEVYDLIRNDLKWLNLDWDEEYIQSQRLDIYYRLAKKLLKERKAYVCTCDPEDFRSLRNNQGTCPCRDLSSEENLSRWEEMLVGGFEEKESVVRIKTDLNNPNPALRDWPALRIVASSHPLTDRNYRVWPLYNFSVSIDDHKMGITHVLRGKEHEVNEQRQRQLFEHLEWEYPTALQHGRLSISNAILSKTRIMEGIKNGEYEGYDDIRLGTIAAVKRRGIVPKALKKIVLESGLTRSNSTLSWNTLYTYNRRIIDERANRYFFVENPKKIIIHDTPEMEDVQLRLHPDKKDRGERILPLDQEDGDLKIWISEKDADEVENRTMVRLKDLLNFEVISKNPLEANFDSFELKDAPIIQWVSRDPTNVEVLMPDGEIAEGYGEPEVEKLNKGEIIQFERYGFVRVDKTDTKVKVIYSHP